MPNKQLDLAYLAGLWDGEGSITVWHSIRKVSKRRKVGADRYIAAIVLVNTNKPMIDNVERILNDMDIYPTIYFRNRGIKNKDVYQLMSRNLTECETVLKAIYPYLIAKKQQAKLTLQFIESRKKILLSSKGWGHGTPYSEDEIKWSKEIQRLNKRGKARILRD
jgi:intein/homing endonuclease